MERGKSNAASNCSPAGEEVISAVFSGDVCALAIGSCTPGDLLSDKAEFSTGTRPQPDPSIHPMPAKGGQGKGFFGIQICPEQLTQGASQRLQGWKQGQRPMARGSPVQHKEPPVSCLGTSWMQEEPLLFADSVCPKAAQGTPKEGPREPWSRGRSASSPSAPYLRAMSSWLQPLLKPPLH